MTSRIRSLILLTLLAAPLNAADPPKDPPKEPAKEAPKDAPKETPKDPKEKEKPKTIDELVKDYEKLPGIFTLYRKLDANKQKLYLELTESQFDKLFLMQITSSSGGVAGMSGMPVADVVLKFTKLPDERIGLFSPPTNLQFKKGTPQAVAVAREFPENFLDIFTPAAKQDERKSVLLDVSDLFRNGIVASGKAFTSNLGNVDGGKSFYLSVKSLPENLFIQMQYAMSRASSGFMILGGGPPPAPRSAPVKINYNISLLPQTDYVPRLADGRVGYFVNGMLSQGRIGQESFDNDSKRDSRVVYINRFRLEKADPNAGLSVPKKPIVFWIDNAFPLEYRNAARDGLLMWNKAFERIGFKDAIVVKQMPDDADWDHADLRYNVIRWVTTLPSPDSAMAVALLRENPLTGEMLGANINMSANWVRFARAEAQESINPSLSPKSLFEQPKTEINSHPATCSFGHGMSEQAWLGWQGLEMQMALAPRIKVDEAQYANAMLASVVAHEMGHILGLRHNFIASTLHDGGELASGKTMAQTGLSASVMDYTGFNIYALKTPGAELFSSTVGPYDMWAIEYGYKPLDAKTPEAELPALKAIAARCNEPGLAYQTDDMADGYDPLVVRFDLGRDPLTYMETNSKLYSELLKTLGDRLPRAGEDYSEFTRQFYRLFVGRVNATLRAGRYIGGMHARKNYRGDKDEKPSFEPIPAADQRRALKLIIDTVFSANAFDVPPAYFSKLAGDPHGMSDFRQFSAFPIRDLVTEAQIVALRNLFDGARLDRIADNEYKTPGTDQLTLLELFRSVQSTVWSELTAKTNISTAHRELQRAHLEMLISYANMRGGSDVKMLAWDCLRRLNGQITEARKGTLDAYTRLHLEQTQSRLQKALAAQVTVAP